ncbi:MAG: hypothetical protein ABJM06_07210 [Gilvibacter sp.]
MKFSIKAIILVLLFASSFNAQSQSYIDDAKNLADFKAFYELNQKKTDSLQSINSTLASAINLSQKDVQLEFAKEVFDFIIKSKYSGQGGSTDGNAGDGDDDDDGETDFAGDDDVDTDAAQDDTNNTAPTIIPRTLKRQFLGGVTAREDSINDIQKEIAFYVKFASTDAEDLYANPDLVKFPEKFVHLSTTIDALNAGGAASFTGGAGVSSILGVSQAEILQGIAQWALERAEQELMQSFLREWVQKIENDPVLSTTFPNTLKMLSTSDVSSIITDGATWKATFLEDFDNIPANSPAIFESIITDLKIDISSKAKREIKAGLNVMASLSKDLDFNKPAEQILTEIGQTALLDAKSYTDPDDIPMVDRALVGTQLLMKIIENYSKETVEFVKAFKISNLNTNELEALWKLIVMRDSNLLEVVFNIDRSNAQKFFREVETKLGQFQAQLINVVQSVERILNLAEEISSRTTGLKSTFSFDEFGTYVESIFGIVESTVDVMSIIGNESPVIDDIREYSSKYLSGLKYITGIQKGVSTKQYGTVVLNTLNFLIWINDVIAKDKLNGVLKAKDIVDLVNDLDVNSEDAVNTAFVLMENTVSNKLKDYPESKTLIISKLEGMKTSFSKDETITIDGIKEKLQKLFEFNASDIKIISSEVASEKLQKLQTTSEAVNKYGKLMATIILAKSSDDIKQALESVANQTGGYIIKQKSYFSTTLSFYPGAAAGFESVKASGQESTSGAYASATLPIGVEWAVGTNWKPIGAVGLFVQVLDLGAVLNYSLNNDNAALNENPEIGFKQVLSPGGFITLHITNSPITIGLGAKYLPELRTISTDQTAQLQANAFQVGAFLSVDLNVFTLSASDNKYPLNSKTLNTRNND